VLPRDLAFDVADRLAPMDGIYAGLLNLGWGVFPNDAQPLSLIVHNVYAVDKATAALLTLNYTTYDPVTLGFRVNGHAWHEQAWPFPTCYEQNQMVLCGGAKTVAFSVPLAEVQPGDNTVEFHSDGGTGVSNVDLILVGAGGVAGPDRIFADGFE